jgi:sec-independent protein translocase protein TatA
MPGNIGLPEIIIVLVIVLIVFGPKRLPELARSVGRASREFKTAVHEDPAQNPEGQATEIAAGEDAGPTVNATPVGETEKKPAAGG